MSFRGESRFTSWLYRLTWTTVVESGRKEQRRASALQRWQQGAEREESVAPRDEVDTARLIAVVQSHLEQLPPRQRAVFALADLEDRQAEIAEMLEMAEATVRVTLFNARRAIRARMMATQPTLREEFESCNRSACREQLLEAEPAELEGRA